jgi:predicted nucleotidyltransferase component of viral defense system
MNLISREKFEYISKRILHYPLHDAEKDYFLTLVMEIISSSKLNKKLVFKGGTAIYHCYLEQFRFSEDLDFTAIDKKFSLIFFERLFTKYSEFEIKKSFTSNATVKIERLKYQGLLETPNSIKVEVDKLQNVYLQPLAKQYKNVWGVDFEVSVMDPIEICAEKIRACNERFRYRDFYDLFMLLKYLQIDIEQAIKILPKKEIRKDISKVNVLKHLDYALEEISKNSDTVYYKEKCENSDLKNFFNKLQIPDLAKNI